MEYVFVLFHIIVFGIAPSVTMLWILRRVDKREKEKLDADLREIDEMLARIEANERRRRQAYIDAMLNQAMREYEKPKKTVYWWDFLGVPKDASKEEINRAYKAKALVMHPDKGGSDKMMASLNKARELGLRGK